MANITAAQVNDLRPQFLGRGQETAATGMIYVAVRAILFAGLTIQGTNYIFHDYSSFSSFLPTPEIRCGARVCKMGSGWGRVFRGV